jgi:mRNA interferase RelE/StbE
VIRISERANESNSYQLLWFFGCVRIIKYRYQYGEPLRKTLKGYWKLRVGDCRVVYKIVKNEIWILGITHRKKVYDEVDKRK